MAKKSNGNTGSFTLLKKHAIEGFAISSEDKSRFPVAVDHVMVNFERKVIMATNGVAFVSVPIETSGNVDFDIFFPAAWLALNRPQGDEKLVVDFTFESGDGLPGSVKLTSKVAPDQLTTGLPWPSHLLKEGKRKELLVSLRPEVFRILDEYAKKVGFYSVVLGLSRDVKVGNSHFTKEPLTFHIFDDDCSGDESTSVVAGGLIMPTEYDNIGSTADEVYEVLSRCFVGCMDSAKEKEKANKVAAPAVESDSVPERKSAKVDKPEKLPESKPVESKPTEKPKGSSPERESKLRTASYRGDVDAIRKLIEQGTNVNAADSDGYTALTRACVKGHVEAIKELIAAGADVNHEPSDKITAIQTAAFDGHLEVCKILMAAGADPEVKDVDDWNAWEKAEFNEHHEVVKYLKGAISRKGKK